MRLLTSCLLSCALLAALHGSARAWTYGDTLTVIWKPLPNLPSFVRPGDTLTVWANAPSAASGWNASLRLGSLGVPLALAGGGWQPSLGRWVLGFRLPPIADGPQVPEEVYDLTLGCDVCAPDTARHAVKVLPDFRHDYYFAQISDTHLPTHALSNNGVIDASDTTGMADFDAVIADLNVIHPEFILHTGDMVNEGELEEYLGMYEMGRAQQMIGRLRDPMFLSSGNHDIGGWKQTAPPDGTSRKDWWRYYGWPFLANPPAGDPYHSQDYHFDYGLLHVVGLEAYINNGSYDSYMTNIWGAQSFTNEQLNWLAQDLAAVPAGHAKLAFYHYDFGGTLAGGSPGPNFSQINPAALGLDGAIWGHNHGVAEDMNTARSAHPFNLGIQSVIYNAVAGGRTFRIFRVHDATLTPGPMHHAGAAVDSLALAWSAPNDGTRSRLTATVTNRFGETWDRARLVFYLAPRADSVYGATGGNLAQTFEEGGRTIVYVDCVVPASGVATVSVAPTTSVAVGTGAGGLLSLSPPDPNPFTPVSGPLVIAYALPRDGVADLGIYDLAGRRVALLADVRAAAGPHEARWNGRADDGRAPGAGVYLIRLRAFGSERVRKVVLVR